MLEPSPSATAREQPAAGSPRALRVAVAVLACLLLAIAAYWSALLSGQRNQQREVQAQTWLRVDQMALAVSVQVQTLLSGLDYTLQSLESVYATRDRDALAAAVQAVYGAYPPGMVTQIAVADATGEIVYSNLEAGGPPSGRVSIYDRDHFQVHARQQVQGMYVGKPVRGRVSQRWSIQLTHAVRRDGAFIGVLVLSLSPDHIARYFQALAGSEGDVITLMREDGAYLARSQAQDEVLGQALPQELAAHFVPGQARGRQVQVSPVDGVQRMYAWSRVAGQPLVASVGLDRQGVLGPLQADFARTVVRNGLGTALVLLGAGLTVWLALQRERSDRLRLRGERRFARLAQEAPGGLFQCRVDEDGQLQLVFSTPQFYAVHGLPATSGVLDIQTLRQRIWPEDLPAFVASIRASLAGQDTWDHKYRVQDPAAPGGLRWLHSHARAQREDDGTLLWHGHVHDVTQDQALQEAIRQSEERLRMAVRAVRDGLWEWNCETGQVHWDARCWEMLGYPGDAFTLDIDGFLSLVHPSDWARVKECIERHLAAGEEYRVEMRLRTAHGGWRSIESRGEVTRRDEQGRALRMLGMHTDIHERVEQARLLSALLDKSSALVLVVTPQREIIHVNERAALAFGLPAGLQAQRTSFRVLHPDEESFARFASLYASLRERGSVRVEWLLRVADGSTHWFDMQGALLAPQESDGNVIWTLIDTDARHRAEIALDEARRTLDAIIDRFPSGIVVTDAHGQSIVAANQELAQVLRLPGGPGPLVGLTVAQLAERLPPPLGDTLLQRGGDGAFATGKSVQQLADGRYLEVEALALRDQGQAIGHCWVIDDVTERRQRERRLETLALTDALTGVPNRRAFLERLDTEIRHLQGGLVGGAALLMLDIDHFKRVNDTYGHAAGDVVLRTLTQTIARTLRKEDMVGRIGGEEFAVLLSGASAEAGYQRAEDMRRAVAALQIPLAGGAVLRITISLGLYGMTAQDGSGAASLERADAAMYFSKRHGRNQTTLWRPDLPTLTGPHAGGPA